MRNEMILKYINISMSYNWKQGVQKVYRIKKVLIKYNNIYCKGK